MSPTTLTSPSIWRVPAAHSLGWGSEVNDLIQNRADQEPAASITGPATATGEGGRAQFQVTLSGKSDCTTSIWYETQNGTATAGYQATSGFVTVAAGSTTAQIPVAIVNSGGVEPDDECFYVKLTAPSGTSVAWNAASTSAAIQPVNLAFSGDALAAAGSPFTLNLQASNLGNLTIGEWKIDWGDGRPPANRRRHVVFNDPPVSGQPFLRRDRRDRGQ